MVRGEHIWGEELVRRNVVRKLSQAKRRDGVTDISRTAVTAALTGATHTTAFTGLDVCMATVTAAPSESVGFLFIHLRASSPRVRILSEFHIVKNFIFPGLWLFSDLSLQRPALAWVPGCDEEYLALTAWYIAFTSIVSIIVTNSKLVVPRQSSIWLLA